MPPRGCCGATTTRCGRLKGVGDDGDIVCHGDFGAWNIVWDGFDPVGLLDREYAHVAPADRHLLG